MKSALIAARHHIKDIQRTARRYHDTAQDVLRTAHKIADDITDEAWAPRTGQRRSPHYSPASHTGETVSADSFQPSTDWYRHDPTTQRLTRILDGAHDHAWTDRHTRFSSALPSLGSEQAAYLHGYLDAQSYLNEHHPVLASQFHATVNHDGLGYSTRSRRRTTPPTSRL